MKFYSDTNRPPIPVIGTSSPMRYKYERVKELKGHGYLRMSGKENTHLLVQESAKGHTLPELFSRFSRGDLSAIPEPQAVEVDMTAAPASAMEAQDRLARAYQYFEQLPADIRREFNNDGRLFLEKISSPEYIESKRKEASDLKAAADAAKAQAAKEALSASDIAALKSLLSQNHSQGGTAK